MGTETKAEESFVPKEKREFTVVELDDDFEPCNLPGKLPDMKKYTQVPEMRREVIQISMWN